MIGRVAPDEGKANGLRLCSFIATTNDPTPLPAGDGSRRYLCIEVTGQVDINLYSRHYNMKTIKQ